MGSHMMVGNKGEPYKAGRRGRQKDQKQRTTGREAQASKGNRSMNSRAPAAPEGPKTEDSVATKRETDQVTAGHPPPLNQEPKKAFSRLLS